MAYPFMHHEMMGIPPPPPKRLKRSNNILYDSLPATFKLNWDSYVNESSSQRQTRDGYTTWMGPPFSTEAGYLLESPDCGLACLLRSVQLLRGANFEIQVIPDHYDEKNSFQRLDRNRDSAQNTDPEHRFLKYSFGEHVLKVYRYEKKKKEKKEGKEKVLVATMTTFSLDHPWLVIECCHTEETTNLIGELLKDDYNLAKLPHGIQNNIPIMLTDYGNNNSNNMLPGYQLVARTESTPGDMNPTTLFVLSKNKKVVGKVLCYYQNGEMDSVGPTIALFEIAEQWQGHGLGSALLRAIQRWYCNLFVNRGNIDDVNFSVTSVSNVYALQWFQNHGFRDLDGMGEELGKELLDPDTEDDIRSYRW